MHTNQNKKQSNWIMDFIKALPDRLLQVWPMLTTISVGGASAWADAATKSLEQYAPWSWMFCGLLGALTFSLVYLVFCFVLRYREESLFFIRSGFIPEEKIKRELKEEKSILKKTKREYSPRNRVGAKNARTGKIADAKQ